MTLPLGKLPPTLLAKILSQAPISDPRVIVGPAVGVDCAVVELDKTCLVFKSDPITFASDQIGWYTVQINVNDIATTGALPRWLLVTALLPEGKTTPETVETISGQLYEACEKMDISVIGGHTEITHGLNRPILVGALIGEVARENLITPQGASVGDRILLTGGVPIEGTAILAREFADELKGTLSEDELREARDYLTEPGISVLQAAQTATGVGGVTAMHDPTEGGLAGALWELAEACGHSLEIDPENVIVSPVSEKICAHFDIDPLATIASGALLLTIKPESLDMVLSAFEKEGISCAQIGTVEESPVQVRQATSEGVKLLPRPARDEIARVYENHPQT
jgi:hydrogenase maturation factor